MNQRAELELLWQGWHKLGRVSRCSGITTLVVHALSFQCYAFVLTQTAPTKKAKTQGSNDNNPPTKLGVTQTIIYRTTCNGPTAGLCCVQPDFVCGAGWFCALWGRGQASFGRGRILFCPRQDIWLPLVGLFVLLCCVAAAPLGVATAAGFCCLQPDPAYSQLAARAGVGCCARSRPISVAAGFVFFRAGLFVSRRGVCVLFCFCYALVRPRWPDFAVCGRILLAAVWICPPRWHFACGSRIIAFYYNL